MKTNRLITIDGELNEKLSHLPNVSAFIEELCLKHFAENPKEYEKAIAEEKKKSKFRVKILKFCAKSLKNTRIMLKKWLKSRQIYLKRIKRTDLEEQSLRNSDTIEAFPHG